MGVDKVSRGLMNELYVCECVKVFERASLAKCVCDGVCTKTMQRRCLSVKHAALEFQPS